MTRRRTLIILTAAGVLLGTLNLLLYSLYASGRRTVLRALDDRLSALGETSAAWLSSSTGDADAAFLRALAGANRLEDAYLFGGDFRLRAGARAEAGAPLNLLRLDADRVEAALAGTASAEGAYDVGGASIHAAYFPVAREGARLVLALEAGAQFRAGADRLRTTYLSAVALSVALSALFATGLLLVLGALERARLAHGRGERLAAVGQMAAMVAHEVRNPLGILRGQVELARERLPAGSPAREVERFADMLVAIDRLNRLTEEFLALARDAAYVRVPIKLGPLVEQVVADARLEPAAAGARLEARPGADGLTVAADADKLRQALLNLVLNALQVGGEGVSVTVEASAAGGEARLRVGDDGPGVDPALRGTLFEPFASGRSGGSGLGLAIARRIAERHDGRLVLDPVAAGERGASFSLYLPLQSG